MSYPCSTLAEAIVLLSRPKASKTIFVDLVGVVVQVVINHSPASSSALVPISAYPLVEIDISDESISESKNLCARVRLFGSRAIAEVNRADIRSGDVLRFNQVCLKDILSTESINAKPDSHAKVYRFQHSSTHPVAFEWLHLGRIDGSGAFAVDDSSRRTAFLQDYLPADSHLERLARWWKQHVTSQSPTCQAQAPIKLDRPSCRLRTIDEAQNLVGATSHIKGRLRDYNQVLASPRKSKRSRSGTRLNQTGFTSLSDLSGASVALIDPGCRLEGFFRSKKPSFGDGLVHISYLVCRRGRDVETTLVLPPDEVVLVTTKDTTIRCCSTGRTVGEDEGKTERTGTATSKKPKKQLHGNYVQRSVTSVLVGVLADGKVRKKPSVEGFVRIADAELSRGAKLTLALQATPFPADRPLLVAADRSIVERLCSGFDFSDILNNNENARHAAAILEKILAGSIQLQWTLTDARDCQRQSLEVLKVKFTAL